MSTTPAYLPLAFLLGSAIWIAANLWEISDLKSENENIQIELTLRNSRPSLPISRATIVKTALDFHPVNWADVLRKLQSSGNFYGIFKTNRRLNDALSKLTGDQLIAALDELNSSTLSDPERQQLEDYLLGLLIYKDPAYIIDRFQQDLPVTSAWDSWLSHAIAQWTRLSPAEAVPWFDFLPPDSRFEKWRTEFEHAIITALLAVDDQQARQRFATLSPERQKAYFHDFNFGTSWELDEMIEKGMVKRFADLVRLMPQGENSPLAWPLTATGETDKSPGLSLIQKSLEGWGTKRNGNLPLASLKDYFQKIEATPTETSLCLDTLHKHGRLDLTDQPEHTPEALRTWLESELQQPAKQ